MRQIKRMFTINKYLGALAIELNELDFDKLYKIAYGKEV